MQPISPLFAASGVVASVPPVSVMSVTPSLGTPTTSGTSTSSDQLTYSLPFTTVTGDFLAFIATRSNRNPSPRLSVANAVYDKGGGGETTTPMTTVGGAALDGAQRLIVEAAYVRGVAAQAYTIDFVMDEDSTRDSVLMAVDVTNMKADGSPVGVPVLSVANGSSASSVGGSFTPTDAAALLVAFGALGHGGAGPITGTNLTVVADATSGAGGDTLDHAAALASATASTTAARTLTLTGDTAATYQALVAFELLPG